MHIYVIKCENNKYYVGKPQKSAVERFNEHQNGQGAEWTRIYRPLKIVEFIEGDRFDEDKYTKMYMEKYGIENVRGGRYTSIHLNADIMEHLENELLGCNDKCFTCHENGHFSRNCPHAENIWMTKRVITKLLREKRCLEKVITRVPVMLKHTTIH